MKILLVEDTVLKQRLIAEWIEREFTELDIVTAASMMSGRDVITNEHPDLILLDMSLPVFDFEATRDGFIHLPYAGIDVFEWLDRRQERTPVLVVTSFDRFGEGPNAKTLSELHTELEREFPDIYRGAVYYSSVSDGWQPQLRELLRKTLVDLHSD